MTVSKSARFASCHVHISVHTPTVFNTGIRVVVAAAMVDDMGVAVSAVVVDVADAQMMVVAVGVVGFVSGESRICRSGRG